MSHSTFRVIGILLSMTLAGLVTGLAQDNPMLDTPPIPSSTLGPSPGQATINVITTPDGFDNFDLGTTNAEPHMSSNIVNPLWFFNAFNPTGSFQSWHTQNGGLTWTTNNPAWPTNAGDPVTAYDSLGNLYYEVMKNPINGCWVARSENNGQTWSSAVTSIAGNDKNWIAADQTMGPFANYVYTTMTNSGVGNFARSTDLGVTWTAQRSFSPHSLPGMMVAVGPNVLSPIDTSGGCVYVVTHSGSNSAGVYTFFASRDGGLTFVQKSQHQFSNYIGTELSGRSTVQGMRCRPYPFITADNSFGPYRGRLYLVYASNNPAGNGNKSDIFLRYSTDQGGTWSTPRVVNDDENSQNNFQFHPAIWCDKQTGRLYIKFYDTRRVPTSDSMDVYATYTDDGGNTFAPNQRITNRTFRINISGATGPTYRGDYDAITANEHTSMSVWTDFRNAPSPNYTGMTAYFPDFAMLVSPTADTLGQSDSIDVWVKVPAIKLYTNSVKFIAEAPPGANIDISFPQGDSLTSYPDSIPMRVKFNNVPNGVYAINVTGSGPNGTPVHRRTVTLSALGPSLAVIQPNGGEQLYGGTSYQISWSFFLVDSVKIEYSTNAGSSWILITPGVPARPWQNQHPKLHAIGVEESGDATTAVYNWIVPNTPSTQCVVRVSDKNNPAVFDVSNTPFTILATPIPIWTEKTSGTGRNLYSVSVIDTLRAWAGGDSGLVIRTVNGGATWNTVGALVDPIYNIYAFDQSRAIVATYSTNNARILRTINGGLSWQTVYQNTNPSAFINAINMFDAFNGYAEGDPIGGQWTLLRTTDGGATWFNRDTLPAAGSEAGWNNSMAWIGSQDGWFGTNNSRVYRTTDGGTTWTPAATAFTNTYAVDFATTSLGLAGGNQLARSQDGGASWTNTPAQPPGSVVATSALDLTPPRWYSVDGNTIHKTTDHGGTLTADHVGPATYQHIDVKMIITGPLQWVTGYAVGNSGTITKYMELLLGTGLAGTDGNVPERFSLTQNYPNPFNPVTSFKFQVPVPELVTLKLYDVLGREIATLVHEVKEAGTYEVSWEARDFASGVYYYRMTAGSFSDVKKLVLLK